MRRLIISLCLAALPLVAQEEPAPESTRFFADSPGPSHWDLSASMFWARHLHETTPKSPWRGGQLVAKYEDELGPFSLRVEGRGRWNDAYRDHRYSQEAREAYRFQADLREAYLSLPLSGWTLSAGLQQVVWGKADALRIVDQVNPIDLQMFVLPDLNEMRMPVPMIRGQRMLGEWTMECFYIPWFTPAKFAKAGSEYHIPVIDPELAPWVTMLPEQRPAKKPRNGELGASMGRSFEGVDVNFFLFDTRDDNPAYRQTLTQDAQGVPRLQLQAEYHRQFMAGLSVVNTLGGGFVLRSELAYSPRVTYMSDELEREGLSRHPTWTGLLGLDYLWRDWLFTFQASDRGIAGWREQLEVPERSTLLTLSATGTSFSGRLETRLAISTYTQNGDGSWYQARFAWKPDDHWAYSAGLDVLAGPPQGFFGQFREKDRLWVEAKVHF